MNLKSPRNTLRWLPATALVLALAVQAPAMAAAPTEGADWKPKVSETFIKLPVNTLDKRIDRDFMNSTLGQSLRQQENDIAGKLENLAEIDAAIDLADGEQLIDLKHNYLVEKRGYVELARARTTTLRDRLETKKRVLERVLEKLGESDAAMTADQKALVESQDAANKRLESALAAADQMFAHNPFADESDYSREYEQKRSALEMLRARVAEHPMSQGPEIDGTEVSKADYVRHLVAATEGELALLTMEEEMLGFMAKLVALDALALAEEVEDPELIDSDVPEPVDVDVAATRFFAD